jgi:negative regulator of sigma E activity
MTFDDETLMAYADGELDEAQRAAIAAALQKDPQLARRVERHRALRAEIAGAYATVIDQPLPERLLSAAGAEPAGRDRRRGAVLQFPARAVPPAPRRWGLPQWAGMAASLVLGVLLSWKFFAPADQLMVASEGTLVARGALASALDQQQASTQRDTDLVQIGISFRMQDGSYCRSFLLHAAATAGLACRADGEWSIPVTASAPASGELRPAASPPPAVLQAIEARISGEPLDAAGEAAAQRGGWNPAAR